MRAAAALTRRLPRVPGGAVRRAAAGLGPRLGRGLAIALLASAGVAALYMLWFRDSSLVAVERVSVTGLTTPEADRIEAALASAARDMTTLHVRTDELEQAIAAFPVVRSVEVVPDFPHGLSIRVVEHRPVAAVTVGRDRVPVAADGTLLRGLPVRDGLPQVAGSTAVVGDHLAPGRARSLVEVAAAAPRSLRPRIERLGATARRGVVVVLADGPELIFGSPERARAKWFAAAAVLADPSAQGASYVDLRIPERPTAGGLPIETIQPVAPAPPDGTAPQPAPQGAAPEQPTQQAPATPAPQPAPAPPSGGAPAD